MNKHCLSRTIAFKFGKIKSQTINNIQTTMNKSDTLSIGNTNLFNIQKHLNNGNSSNNSVPFLLFYFAYIKTTKSKGECKIIHCSYP